MQDFLAFLRKYRYTSALSAVICLFLIATATLFFLGYRVAPGFQILRAGTLIVSDLKRGALVYVDDGFNGEAKNGEMRILLAPGSHRVIVSASEDQPWVEIFTIDAGQDLTVHPIFVPKVNTPTPVSREVRARALQLFNSYQLPSTDAPLSMKSGCAQVYVDLGRIVAVGTTTAICSAPPYLCQSGVCNPTIVFSPTEPIASVVPYPGRDDVLIVAAGSRVFVIELDPRTPQFFSPLIRTGNAVALPWSDHSIIVKSDEGIREVKL